MKASIRISESLYLDNGKHKVPLTLNIKSHEIWRNTVFWWNLFKEEVTLETRLYRSKLLKERKQTTSHSMHLVKVSKEKDVIKRKTAEHINHMLTLGVSKDNTKEVVETCTKTYQIPIKNLEDIIVFYKLR